MRAVYVDEFFFEIGSCFENSNDVVFIWYYELMDAYFYGDIAILLRILWSLDVCWTFFRKCFLQEVGFLTLFPLVLYFFFVSVYIV